MDLLTEHTLKAGLTLIVTLLQLPAMGIFLYFISLSAFGWVRRKEPDAGQFPLKHRFALIVPSHNEEKVIGKIVENLKALDYPESLYKIVVIADNCTDSTAQVAREAGALVLERFDPVHKGKGYALEWAFPQIFQQTPACDAVCIFDSDNLVSLNFLKEMNKHLCLGHRVVQGYLDSKNPLDTWISANNSIAFWIGNRMYQLPRSYLGLSNVLGGTGMMIAREVLQTIGWGATCLTEDLEFTVKVVLQGMKVYWAHDAVIYDEKPLGLRQSMRQRVRWMKGQADVIARFFVPLLARFWSLRDWVALDMCPPAGALLVSAGLGGSGHGHLPAPARDHPDQFLLSGDGADPCCSFSASRSASDPCGSFSGALPADALPQRFLPDSGRTHITGGAGVFPHLPALQPDLDSRGDRRILEEKRKRVVTHPAHPRAGLDRSFAHAQSVMNSPQAGL